MYVRKTRDEWSICIITQYGEEEVCPAEDFPDAKRLLKEYRQNGYPGAYIRKHRVKVNNGGERK